jgi:hypothetical protein
MILSMTLTFFTTLFFMSDTNRDAELSTDLLWTFTDTYYYGNLATTSLTNQDTTDRMYFLDHFGLL